LEKGAENIDSYRSRYKNENPRKGKDNTVAYNLSRVPLGDSTFMYFAVSFSFFHLLFRVLIELYMTHATLATL